MTMTHNTESDGEEPICHYCGESYQPTTYLERSYREDPDEHNVCSSCLFDVIVDEDEIEPLPRFQEEDQ